MQYIKIWTNLKKLVSEVPNIISYIFMPYVQWFSRMFFSSTGNGVPKCVHCYWVSAARIPECSWVVDVALCHFLVHLLPHSHRGYCHYYSGEPGPVTALTYVHIPQTLLLSGDLVYIHNCAPSPSQSALPGPSHLLPWLYSTALLLCVLRGYQVFLLAMMAYGWYLAICSPLHYSFLMSPEVCTKLVAISWLTGISTGFLPSLMISKLDFCGPKQINHFFCDLPPLMQPSCSNVCITEVVIFTLSTAVLCICFFLTLVSYVFIVSSILRIPSASGRVKTFATCGSHLAVVTIYCGTTVSMYVCPNPHLSPEINKIISVSYTVVTPLLNPVIYSLRNKDFKDTVRKVVRRTCGIYGVRVKAGFFIG